jgi:hypothetical protein
MPVDEKRIDILIQYALLLAGAEEERTHRDLGPIHLIKYVYLADLVYAQRNDGQTFTGVEWKFYKFGPWSQTVNARVAPALASIGADQYNFPSDYGDRDDWVRWCLRDEIRLKEYETAIPPAIAMALPTLVHRFLKDTPSLLDHVYRTPPMLKAAPGEYLDFSAAERDEKPKAYLAKLRMETISEKQRKRYRDRVRQVQLELNKRTEQGPSLVNPMGDARYDDTFEKGIQWLDSLAGDPLEQREYVAEFSDDVWKSAARKGGDVS